MRDPLSVGTWRNAYVDGYRIGGKTGTAKKVGPNGQYMQGNYILSFLGAAPMNDPKAVVYLAIDTPYHNVPNFININKSKIKPSPYYKYLYIGNGSTVID